MRCRILALVLATACSRPTETGRCELVRVPQTDPANRARSCIESTLYHALTACSLVPPLTSAGTRDPNVSTERCIWDWVEQKVTACEPSPDEGYACDSSSVPTAP